VESKRKRQRRGVFTLVMVPNARKGTQVFRNGDARWARERNRKVCMRCMSLRDVVEKLQRLLVESKRKRNEEVCLLLSWLLVRARESRCFFTMGVQGWVREKNRKMYMRYACVV
jgi:hypothetical protein